MRTIIIPIATRSEAIIHVADHFTRVKVHVNQFDVAGKVYYASIRILVMLSLIASLTTFSVAQYYAPDEIQHILRRSGRKARRNYELAICDENESN